MMDPSTASGASLSKPANSRLLPTSSVPLALVVAVKVMSTMSLAAAVAAAPEPPLPRL
jgi:hypothetical protein